jgi:hypothetical protein
MACAVVALWGLCYYGRVLCLLDHRFLIGRCLYASWVFVCVLKRFG